MYHQSNRFYRLLPFNLFALLFIFLTVLSCSEKAEENIELSPSSDDQTKNNNPIITPIEHDKLSWIAKVTATLRLNQPLSEQDRPSELLQKTREEVVDFFLSQKNFEDVLLDFNLYFLGKKTNSLFTFKKDKSKRYLSTSYQLPGVLSSIHEYSINGNYLKFLELNRSLYFSHFEPVETDFGPLDPKVEKLWRDREFQNLVQKYANAAIFLLENPTLDMNIACLTLSQNLIDFFFILNNTGLPISIINAFFELSLTKRTQCPHVIDRQAFAQSMLEEMNQLGQFKQEYDRIAANNQNYKILSPSDIFPIKINLTSDLDLKKAPSPIHFLTYNYGYFFWNSLPNSSTNYNRKRAAYFLNQYFCDDLTPVLFVKASDHTKDAHSSDPGCVSCHYKLDPMAGFFKHLGQGGNSFEGLKNIFFDDFATMDRQQYELAWKDGPGKREWNIGLIRSQYDEKLNHYGESIEDLFKIIQTAPEVKKCIVKRASEYLLGKNTLIDPGYLDYLSRNFITEAQVNSSVAIRNLFKRLVLSNTFAQKIKKPDVCYDSAPGPKEYQEFNVNKSPPCQIAHLFQKNCGSCHKSDFGPGNLNLTNWIQNAQGEYFFAHFDDQGKSLSKSESIDRLIDRISSNDDELTMPPISHHISSIERAEMYKWLIKQK
jgi:hypothetical protein